MKRKNIIKALKKNDLRTINQEDISFIFNQLISIIRNNSISDKSNAFNKVFNLFLCKIVDECSKTEDKELAFQWLEGQDDHITFQKRLMDLYNKGMREILEKDVIDLSDDEFDKRFNQVEEEYRKKFKDILTEVQLKKNNEFAIKEVYDDSSFEENSKVVKQVVELLQVYKIRYNYRQQFLSDFFELLLTTGLKQESGQFFTPVPVARFIIKSLPLKEITTQKIKRGNKDDLLPTIIDYATGSGHFLIKSMEEIQKHIQNIDESKCNPITRISLKKWKEDPFDWAEKYVYGIEKDYRLVKTAIVSCYIHGDGLAKIIHGDGLGDFKTSTEFKDLLKTTDSTYSQDNKKFDIVISNPPYSVSAFKGTLMTEDKAKQAFDLYTRLTDQSPEIECLFIERTKQLLKDGGLAGIILPISILSNTGIYTQAREILLKYFEIIAITKLGSNTFMATGTNTVILFLRRRNNADAYNVEELIKKTFNEHQDFTINGIEKPIEKYLIHVWNDLTFEDYKTLLQKIPNKKVEAHEIFQEYKKKIKVKNKQEFWNHIFALEQDKLLYFILTYSQKLVLVETGEKYEEKYFLGYEFRNRRGKEGIHPIIKGKSIDECTQLYDIDSFTNPEKASFYIYKAFNGEFDLDIPENLQKNINYQHLKDMLTFDQVDFEKTISLNVKKKIQIKSKWDLYRIGDIFIEREKSKIKVRDAFKTDEKKYPFFTSGNSVLSFNNYLVEGENIFLSTGGNAIVNFYEGKASYSTDTFCISTDTSLKPKYLYFWLLKNISYINVEMFKGAGLKHLQKNYLRNFKIPLPPKSVQEKILTKIDVVEQKEKAEKEKVKSLREEIENLINEETSNLESYKIADIADQIFAGGDFSKNRFSKTETKEYKIPIYSNSSRNEGLYGFTDIVKVSKPCLTISARGTIGYIKARYKPFYPIIGLLVLVPKPDLAEIKFLEYVLKKLNFSHSGAIIPRITVPQLSQFTINLPSIEKQKNIINQVKKIEKQITQIELELVTMNGQKEQILKKYLE